MDYLAIGAVEQLPVSAPEPEHLQPLLVVVKENKKARVCIDLSQNMNEYIPRRDLRYESVHSAVKAAWPGCWFAKLDLSDCFLSFLLHPEMWRYFSFRFGGRIWRFKRMPFGLNDAPRICTLLLSVISFALTQAGIIHKRYLDDFILIGHSRDSLQAQLDQAIAIIRSFGLVVNESKTVRPTQSISFLGVQLDSLACTLACTRERVEELLALSATFMSRATATRRELMQLMGKLSFASQVLIGARPFLRSLCDLIAPWRHGRPGLRVQITLPTHFKDDLTFWRRVLERWNGIAKWRDEPNPVVISTDASFDGFGIFVESVPSDLAHRLTVGSGIAGYWETRLQRDPSFNIGVREFFAVLFAAHHLAPLLRNRTLHLHCDNLADVAIINRQSTKSPQILHLLRALYSLAARFNFSVRAFHRPGVDNVVADYLSRPEKHEFSFAHPLASSLPLSSVHLVSSNRLQLVPLQTALANCSFELSHYSQQCRSGSTLVSATRRCSAASSDSAPRSTTTQPIPSLRPSCVLPASISALSASSPLSQVTSRQFVTGTSIADSASFHAVSSMPRSCKDSRTPSGWWTTPCRKRPSPCSISRKSESIWTSNPLQEHGTGACS